MEGDTSYTEKVCATKEIAEMLDMAVSTVRKNIVDMEKTGIPFYDPKRTIACLPKET